MDGQGHIQPLKKEFENEFSQANNLKITTRMNEFQHNLKKLFPFNVEKSQSSSVFETIVIAFELQIRDRSLVLHKQLA